VPKIVDPEDRRLALANAAIRIISTVGLDGVRLRDVAAEAGWTTGALTHYFPDKRALLIMALQVSLDQRQRLLDTLPAEGDELRALLEQALPLDEERLRHWRVSQAFSVQSWSDPELTAIQRKAYRGWRRRIVNLVAKGVADGRLREDLDPEETADEMIAIVDGVALQALFDPDRWPPEKQRAFLDRFLTRISRQDRREP